MKIKFVYHVGFKPDFNQLRLDVSNGRYDWNYGPLQILSLETIDQPI